VSTVSTTTGVTVHLVDGPAEGYYDTAFAEPPDTLRAVSSVDGVAAVLDEPGDIPLIGEQLHIYHRESGPAFTCVRSGRGRGCHVHWTYSVRGVPNFSLVNPNPKGSNQ
jgi:hypothetical protein